MAGVRLNVKGRCRLFNVTLTKHLKFAESLALTAPLNAVHKGERQLCWQTDKELK